MPKATDVKSMFDRIVGRYDLMNRVLSFGQDIRWRKELSRQLNSERKVLDLCCGTGDVARQLLKDHHGRINLVAADFSTAMCTAARDKIAGAPKAYRDSFSAVAAADALHLPFENNSFDFVSVAFGVRNFEDLEAGLKDIARVLNPGGKIAVLEFAPPEGFFLRSIYLPYLSKIPSLLGKILAGDSGAYNYLSDSIKGFLPPDKMKLQFKNAGFVNFSAQKLTVGVTYLYTGQLQS